MLIHGLVSHRYCGPESSWVSELTLTTMLTQSPDIVSSSQQVSCIVKVKLDVTCDLR